MASIYIQRGAKWVITNQDEFTIQFGYRVPGNGITVAAIENSLKKPGSDGLICEKIVVGKPDATIIDLICGQHDLTATDRSKMIMFGDRPNTDIALAHNAGIDSCLVLTGVARSLEDAAEWSSKDPLFKPTYIMQSFGDKLEA